MCSCISHSFQSAVERRKVEMESNSLIIYQIEFSPSAAQFVLRCLPLRCFLLAAQQIPNQVNVHQPVCVCSVQTGNLVHTVWKRTSAHAPSAQRLCWGPERDVGCGGFKPEPLCCRRKIKNKMFVTAQKKAWELSTELRIAARFSSLVTGSISSILGLFTRERDTTNRENSWQNDSGEQRKRTGTMPQQSVVLYFCLRLL